MESYPPSRSHSVGGDDFDPRGDDKGKTPEKDRLVDRKGIINRVNRACNNCRRMKMRCVGAEDPPCKRCRNGGLECVMEKPGRSAGDTIGEDRIRSLETQVSSIQNTLSDLVQTLRAGMSASSAASNGSGHTPNVTSTPEYAVGGTTALSNILPAAGSPRHSAPTFHPATALASQPQFSPAMTPPVALSTWNQRAGSAFNPYATLGAAHSDSPGGDQVSTTTFRRPLAPASTPSNTHQPWQAASVGDHNMSLPPSRAGSEGADGDILAADGIMNPLGTMSNMAGLVEAAVERAREENAQRTQSAVAKREAEGGAEGSPQQKKARFTVSPQASISVGSPSGPVVVEAQGLPQTLAPSKAKAKVKKSHVHAYPDVVDQGYVSEGEARELMAIFYSGSNNFLPCFDPSFDTWESLKVRSPFSITCMVMVGARVRDGGGPPGELQRQAREHAQMIAQGTMFVSVARVEAVQAMSILAAFSENGWLPGGHAVRMALDMGINKSFIKLLRGGMGKGKTPEELEEERPLVVHSRVWFCLYLMEHQMAYGMGRPAILREDESIHQCRRLLEHPLSIPSDARLISTVELTALRAPLHVELTAFPDLPIDQNTLKRLKQANHEFDSWERYWDRVLADRFAKTRGDFYRESLAIQRQYAELFVNSQLLRGIREPSDVSSMPEEKRNLAIRAMRNAQQCLEICLRKESYRNSLRYAVHYTHVCAAFAASFLIRIARLFPQELNLKKTTKDVEELARVLSDIPAGRYARSLRLILRRARRAKVLPAASAIGSPKLASSATVQALTSASTPAAAAGAGTAGPALAAASPSAAAFSPAPLVGASYLSTPGGAPAQHLSASPGNLLFNATSQILEDSPQSAHEISEFDFLFAQENLERSGVQLGEGDPLPLFLDGHSLGGSLAPTDMAPFVGLEHFFLPADVDNRLAGGANGGRGGPAESSSGDLWW